MLAAIALLVVLLAAYLWTDNDRAGSLAALATVSTLALAIAAALAYQQNSRLVAAAIQEATASRDQATASRDAVEEMQREREWAYRPAVVVTEHQGGLLGIPELAITNVGTGPAFRVKLAVHGFSKESQQHWRNANEWPAIAAGESVRCQLWIPNQESIDRNDCIVAEWPVGEGKHVLAVRYEDWFGTYYRSGGPPRHRPDEWRGHPSTADAPDWVRCEQ